MSRIELPDGKKINKMKRNCFKSTIEDFLSFKVLKTVLNSQEKLKRRMKTLNSAEFYDSKCLLSKKGFNSIYFNLKELNAFILFILLI